MSRQAPSAFIDDIKKAIANIEAYVHEIDYEMFLGDGKTQDAVVRNLEIIGEASKNVPDVVKRRFANVPWSDMAKMRDKLIHHYFGVNLEIVWGIVTQNLPSVLKQLKRERRRKRSRPLLKR